MRYPNRPGCSIDGLSRLPQCLVHVLKRVRNPEEAPLRDLDAILNQHLCVPLALVSKDQPRLCR